MQKQKISIKQYVIGYITGYFHDYQPKIYKIYPKVSRKQNLYCPVLLKQYGLFACLYACRIWRLKLDSNSQKINEENFKVKGARNRKPEAQCMKNKGKKFPKMLWKIT